ncbi:hypothetical protein JKP88DRAFT_285664 [Tribonema minus]|uniref:Protein kinase domain-containing protein n=1 Tax=Tribonema minus TaxID=303371 RepID=A0A835ZHR9_9STRA|nr:hypothetical protein JKP88DRAFT_285664 [Tribonema minus]
MIEGLAADIMMTVLGRLHGDFRMEATAFLDSHVMRSVLAAGSMMGYCDVEPKCSRHRSGADLLLVLGGSTAALSTDGSSMLSSAAAAAAESSLAVTAAVVADYSSVVDVTVWLLGCIFAELLGVQRTSVPRYQYRMPLLPGKSCFPLSADMAPRTPASDRRRFLARLCPRSPRLLEDLHRAASPAALSLLCSVLQFIPARRATVAQALEHKQLAARQRRPPRWRLYC